MGTANSAPPLTTRLFRSAPDGSNSADVSAGQPGSAIRIRGFGNHQFALLASGVYVTSDVTVSPIQWTQLGPNSTPLDTKCDLQVGTSPTDGAPIFFLRVGACNASLGDQVWAYHGTSPGGNWDRVDLRVGNTAGFSVFAVDPSNAQRIFAANMASPPVMVRSDDGGGTWTPDTQLDQLMTGN